MNTYETAFVDELEKIAGIKDTWKAFKGKFKRKPKPENPKVGSEAKAEPKAETKSEYTPNNEGAGIPSQAEGGTVATPKKRNVWPWVIGGGGLGLGAGIAAFSSPSEPK